MKKNGLFFTIAVVLIISAMTLAYIYPFAKSEPVDNQQVGNAIDVLNTGDSTETVDDNKAEIIKAYSFEELRKISLLGGTNPELALKEYPDLGIAREFSLFAEGDAIFRGADTEGKIAVGGSVKADTLKKIVNQSTGEQSSYKYQVGIKNYDSYSADIVVGNGPVENMALDFGYTDDGKTQFQDSKIVAYSSEAKNMNLEDYTDAEKKHFVEADLIDFKSEFERLRAYSQKLANTAPTGEVLEDNIICGNLDVHYLKVNGLQEQENSREACAGRTIVLRGTNKECNIFNIEYENPCVYPGRNPDAYSGINYVLDVPDNSKVIINWTTKNNISINFGYRATNIYYPLSEEKLAEIDVEDNRIVYVLDSNRSYDKNIPGQYIRDEQNNIRPFISVAGGIANKGGLEELSDKILINIPYANQIQLYDCGASILAPNSDVITNPGFNSGYMLGTLICKSYDGDVQFGTHTKKVRRKYNVNISKIDKEAQKNLEGAVL